MMIPRSDTFGLFIKVVCTEESDILVLVPLL